MTTKCQKAVLTLIKLCERYNNNNNDNDDDDDNDNHNHN